MSFKFSQFLVPLGTIFMVFVAYGQVQDTSQNGLLNGTFAFRHVAIQNFDGNLNPTEVTASYGTIQFDGKGNYTLSGATTDNTVSNGAPQPLNVTGAYAIGSNGAGYVANPLYPSNPDNYVYGAVSQGIFTGSSTESEIGNNGLNDIFIAIPLGAAPTNASFTTPYESGVLDFAGGTSAAIKNALFELTPNGQGGFGAITLTGQASNQTATSLTQIITGATYNFSNGSATLTIPLPTGASSTDALFTGSKTLYQSGDGNFILGWTATGYDIFFGVKALTTTGSNSVSQGLYFTTALEDFPAISGTDSYYGSTSDSGDSSGDAIVHQRLNTPTGFSIDYGTNDQINLNPDGTTGTDLDGYNYIFGDGAEAFVAIGTSGLYSLQVGTHAATFSGSGVFLNPIGVVNAASFQPITASLAPGELITLYGTGLASTSMSIQGGQAFPAKLGGVSVMIDDLPCPIYYVSPNQLSVVVPYGVASNKTGLANIQVTNNNVASNIVQMYLTDSAPGSFSQAENGLGFAAALHTNNYELITSDNPAQPGEYISLYLTGLGVVYPAIQDGALGPSSPLSYSDLYNSGNLTVYFNDYGPNGFSPLNPGTIEYAGLAPGLAGLYQINVQVPTSGLASGDDIYVELTTDAADVNQIDIPYGTARRDSPAASAHIVKPRPNLRGRMLPRDRTHRP
jgi:uncharacterized protein (TIGR03437 family)